MVAVRAGAIDIGGLFIINLPIVASDFALIAETTHKKSVEKLFLQLDFALLDNGAIVKRGLPIRHMLSYGGELGHVALQIELFADFAQVFGGKDVAVLHGSIGYII